MLSASTAAAARQKAEVERLEAAGMASAASAFEPIKHFMTSLANALKGGVDASIDLSTDGNWIPSNGLDCYMLFYKLWSPSRGAHELTFYVTGDYRRV